MIRSLLSSSSLPIFELDRTHVEARHKRVRPFDPQRGFSGDPKCPIVPTSPDELILNPWKLAHAVKKADCLRPTAYGWAAYLSALLEQVTVLDWRHNELRLLNGASDFHADFYGTSLAGRIGHGVALLLMEREGYSFSSHYPREPGAQGPDFIVEKPSPTPSVRALLESKGAFGRPQKRTGIKEVLRDGLKQLKGVPTHGASKAFVVGTFLRENGDGFPEPSLIAFVDPDGENVDTELPEDWVRRHNYAAWLDAMGFHYLASDLRETPLRRQRLQTRFNSLLLDGVEFLVVSLGFVAIWPEPHRRTHSALAGSPTHAIVAGLQRSTIETIGDVLAMPRATLAVRLETRGPAFSAEQAGAAGLLSVLSDGTLFGAVPLEPWINADTVDLVL